MIQENSGKRRRSDRDGGETQIEERQRGIRDRDGRETAIERVAYIRETEIEKRCTETGKVAIDGLLTVIQE